MEAKEALEAAVDALRRSEGPFGRQIVLPEARWLRICAAVQHLEQENERLKEQLKKERLTRRRETRR